MPSPSRPDSHRGPSWTTCLSAASSSSQSTVSTTTHAIIHCHSPSRSLSRTPSHSPMPSSRYHDLAAFAHLNKPHHRRTRPFKPAMWREQDRENTNRTRSPGNYMRAVAAQQGQQDGVHLPQCSRSDGDDKSRETTTGQKTGTEIERGRTRDRQDQVEESDVGKDHWSHENLKHEMHMMLCMRQ